MKEMLEKIKLEAERRITESGTPEALDEIKVSVLGKKGELTALLKTMGTLTEEERRKVDMTIRDLVDHYKVIDLIKAESIDKESDDLTPIINKILDDYMEFRISLDTVTPEDSEEIEKILEMSDEEYDAYQKAKDDELEAQFEKASKGDTGDISGDEESN